VIYILYIIHILEFGGLPPNSPPPSPFWNKIKQFKDIYIYYTIHKILVPKMWCNAGQHIFSSKPNVIGTCTTTFCKKIFWKDS